MDKKIVYITGCAFAVGHNPFAHEALELLKQNDKYNVRQYDKDERVPREILKNEVTDADGIICVHMEKIDQELLEHATRLKVISTVSVGYDHIDVDACKKRNIVLGHTPDVLTEATAELAIGLLLCTSRRLVEANREVYNGGWGTWRPFWMCGRGIVGSTVGILGMGRIGSSVAKKIGGFSPKQIIYHNRKPVTNEIESDLAAKYVSFDDLLTLSDFLIVSCPLTPTTKHIINTDALNKMKSTAILINISRGALVDQDALYEALKNKKIWAAGLDVSVPEPLPKDHELLKLNNLVMLPHIGSATIETRTQMCILAVHNLIAGLESKPLPASVY